MTIETLGVDIAKNVFQLHGVNGNGRVVLKRRVMRDQLLTVMAQIAPCTVVVEACTGAFYWARKFEALGHQVKLISPQYVKPFVRRQKNDGNDAEAICTAARQPHIPFVPRKSVEQQDIQALHRARQRMVNHRTAVVSQMRGLLLDRGFAFAKSITRARRAIPEILADRDNELTAMARETIAELYDLFRDLDRRIASTTRSTLFSAITKPASASPGSRASAPRPPRPSSRRSETGPNSRTAVISPPGWASCRGNSPAEIARS